MEETVPRASDFLRSWRQRRRLSQLDCALEANISQRHLSFIESGRATPSRDMLLHLAECLDIPLRERNAALLAAGFAPVYPERRLDDPMMSGAREAVDRLLKGHEPFPALAIDRHWNLLAANAALAPLLIEVEDRDLLAPPANVLRLSLHPRGLAPRIANPPEWRVHLLERLRRQIATTQDEALSGLLVELAGYPSDTARHEASAEHGAVLVPLRLKTQRGELSLISTTTVFGTPRDILLSEIAIEAFFPADAATRQILEAWPAVSSASA
ncbi:MAG: transcriptional regulator, family [Proteobacteria bacterium]|nr:transcriptional regulator, family [Pseudomonadota bacterium]